MQTFTIEYVEHDHKYKFIADVEQLDGETTEIRVGGNHRFCVTLHLYADEEYMSIVDFLHDASCSLDAPLSRTDGTVALLNAAVIFAQQLYPSVRYATLTDESVIKCGREKVLPLPEVYMLLHGSTWYATKFRASPFDWSRSKTRALHALRETLKQKPHLSWDFVWERYLSIDMNATRRDDIQQLYMDAPNWHAFFQSIRYGHENCVTWYSWVRSFFKLLSKNLVLTGTTWRIQIPPNSSSTTPLQYYATTKPHKTLKPRYQGQRLFGGHQARPWPARPK